MTDLDTLPEHEPDWQPLRRAIHDSLWNVRIVMPPPAIAAFTAELIDNLETEGITLATP